MKSGKPIEAKPHLGGRLMSSISTENIGIYNYTIKSDFRRDRDREVRSEGDVQFCPATFVVDDIPSVVMPDTDDAITLIVMFRHPDGRVAIVVGTATTLWKYHGLDDPLYHVSGYYDAGYYNETASAWKEIGSGFSAAGRRWECQSIDGYLILNNAADLPMTYRLTDDAVTPIWELRELAIASVGTIVVQNTHLLCMDLRQIVEDRFRELMMPIRSAATVMQTGLSPVWSATLNSGVAGVAGNIMTIVDGPDFVAIIDELQTIQFKNGLTRIIEEVLTPTTARLSGPDELVEPAVPVCAISEENDRFILSETADTLFPGVEYAALVGRVIYLANGGYRTIRFVDEDGSILVHESAPFASQDVLLENPDAYGRYDDATAIERYQNRILHSLPGKPRRFGATFPATIMPTSDAVVFDYPVKSIGLDAADVLLTGMASGNLSASGLYYDGLSYLVSGGGVRGFYANVLASLNAAIEDEATANTVAKSTADTLASAEAALAKANDAMAGFESDEMLLQEIAEAPHGSTVHADALDAYSDKVAAAAAVVSASAAVDQARANKTAADKALAAATEARVAAESASMESEEVEVQLADAVSSISRLETLEHDGAAILKAVALKTVLVIFTETTIFIGRYSTSNFTFNYTLVEIPENTALFYRNTPILVNGQWILYAAENQFCRFDMTNQVPIGVRALSDCEDLFFDRANPDYMESIFAMDNGVTSEIWICFPSSDTVKALRYDYGFDTVAASSADYISGSNALFPGTSKSVFLIGAENGQVLRYGLVAGGVTAGGYAAKTGTVVTAEAAVFTMLHIGQTIKFANGTRFGIVKVTSSTTAEVCGSGSVTRQTFDIEPFCTHRRGQPYTSTLQSGGESFGNESAEKKLHRYWLMLSTFSPDSPLSLAIRSGLSANAMSDKITATVTPPQTMVPLLLSDYLLGDRIEISGINNPLEITGRCYHGVGLNTNSFGRAF